MNNALRVKLRAMLLQMKDVAEQRKLEKHELHPNIAASSVIGGEFNLSPDTIAVLKEMRSVKQQIAATIDKTEAMK